jgi:hypothetical protein
MEACLKSMYDYEDIDDFQICIQKELCLCHITVKDEELCSTTEHIDYFCPVSFYKLFLL